MWRIILLVGLVAVVRGLPAARKPSDNRRIWQAALRPYVDDKLHDFNDAPAARFLAVRPGDEPMAFIVRAVPISMDTIDKLLESEDVDIERSLKESGEESDSENSDTVNFGGDININILFKSFDAESLLPFLIGKESSQQRLRLNRIKEKHDISTLLQREDQPTTKLIERRLAGQHDDIRLKRDKLPERSANPDGTGAEVKEPSRDLEPPIFEHSGQKVVLDPIPVKRAQIGL